MLHLIPAPAHRQALRLGHALRKAWWRARRPHVSGCRVIALDDGGRVLLVRHAYGSGAWFLPGGGLARGENPVAAAIRELREETGCTLHDARLVERVEEPLHGARNHVHIVVGRTADAAIADCREIIEAGFFEPDALPARMPAELRNGLLRWIAAATDAL